jgi:hypothetical protein
MIILNYKVTETRSRHTTFIIRATLIRLYAFLLFRYHIYWRTVCKQFFFRSVYTVFGVPESYHMLFSVVLLLKIMIRDLNCY